MTIESRGRMSVRIAFLAGGVLLGARAEAQHYVQTNVVSDQPGAMAPDANLVNPWGLARSSTSAWWSANNGTGTATLYNGDTGQPSTLIVTIPPAPCGGAHGVPTGAVVNVTTAFELAPSRPGRFLFVTQDGTISGLNPAVDATHAVIKVTSPGAVYTGVAIASRAGAPFLYVCSGVTYWRRCGTGPSAKRLRTRHEAMWRSAASSPVPQSCAFDGQDWSEAP
jgi:hypothetical protein